MIITSANKPEPIFDKHYSIRCQHCQRESSITAISIPRYEFLARFTPTRIGIAYQCDACLAPTFVEFNVTSYDLGNHKIAYDDGNPIFHGRAIEPFEYQYLPDAVQLDFREAALCYSVSAFNAFASMCRRTVQSMSADLGVKGKDRVKKQLTDLRDMDAVDDETFEVLNEVIIAGHDGAHPHLPDISQDRAVVLLELMKDILYQVYVRKAKLEEAARLRQERIELARESPDT